MAGGAGRNRAVEEQTLAALGIAGRDFHLVIAQAGNIVDAAEQVKASTS